MHSNVTSKNVSGFTLAGPPCMYRRCDTDEEGHLCGEDELVALKQAARRVDEHRVRDAVDQVDDALLHFLGRLRPVDRLFEHHAECLSAKRADYIVLQLTAVSALCPDSIHSFSFLHDNTK